MITEKDVVSDETVEGLWSRVEAGLPRPRSRAPFARAGIIAGIVALVIGGGGIASYAVLQTVASQPATPPTQQEELANRYPDAVEMAKGEGISLEESYRRAALGPELDSLISKLEKAAGTRLHSIRIAQVGRYGIDLALKVGESIPAVDAIVASRPDLITVRYVDGPTDTEIYEMIDPYRQDWRARFPELDLMGVTDGVIELMTPDGTQDEAIREYVAAHGAGDLPVSFFHGYWSH